MPTVIREGAIESKAAKEALAAKRDERDPRRLRGVSRELYDLLTARELRKLIDFYNTKH